MPDLVHEGTLLSWKRCQVTKNTSAQEREAGRLYVWRLSICKRLMWPSICGVLPDAGHGHLSGALSGRLSELSVVRERCTGHTSHQRGRGGSDLEHSATSTLLSASCSCLSAVPLRRSRPFTSVCLGALSIASESDRLGLPLLSTGAAPYSAACQDLRQNSDRWISDLSSTNVLEMCPEIRVSFCDVNFRTGILSRSCHLRKIRAYT